MAAGYSESVTLSKSNTNPDPSIPPAIGPRGLHLPQRMTFERWLTVGIKLSELATSSAWCLGDWLIYGETTYSGRYRQAIEQTSLDYQTLRNYAWVARRFHYSRRRPTLSFGHHAEVTALPEPEREYWLRKAEKLSWSRNRLRREVRASLKERESSEDEAEPAIPGPRMTLNLSVSQKQREVYGVAASAYGLSLEDWALDVLERAAKEAVPQVESSPGHNPGISRETLTQGDTATSPRETLGGRFGGLVLLSGCSRRAL